MGVIDEDCVRKANDPTAMVGRRVRVAPDEMAVAIGLVERLGHKLFMGLTPP